jgi:multiple sugar transport system permease protein
MGLLNTYAGLILPFISGSFGIFLCRQYYMSIPKALDEAAKIDGCSPFKIYTSIYLPLSGPILATLTILKSVSVWNDFFYPLIVTNTDNMATVQLGLQKFSGTNGSIQWNLLLSATLITVIPVLIVFLFAQKYFVQGISSSGVKG